jgi:hypothetical protein
MNKSKVTREVYKKTVYRWFANLGCVAQALTPKQHIYLIWYFQSKCVWSVHCRKTGDRREFTDLEDMKRHLSSK